MTQSFQVFRENLGHTENAKLFLQACLEQGLLIEEIPTIETIGTLEPQRLVELSRVMLNIYYLIKMVPSSLEIH